MTPGVGVPHSARGTVTLAEVAPHTGLGPGAAGAGVTRVGLLYTSLLGADEPVLAVGVHQALGAAAWGCYEQDEPHA